MIDSHFIIKYTNALYSTPEADAPRYDEFRDMFSSGQIVSKEWIIDELNRIDTTFQNKKFVVVGSWFGTLGMMLKWVYPSASVTMLDIDPRCEKFINNMIYQFDNIRAVTDDMYLYNYTEDIIVNTSCEHIENVRDWLSLLPKNTMVVLQSNNYVEGNGHVNCVHDGKEFIEQTGLTDIIYAGNLYTPMYTRYMIIGRT